VDAANGLTRRSKSAGRAIIARLGPTRDSPDGELPMTTIFGARLLPHRHCERSEAIQGRSAERFWIASLRSQRRADRVGLTPPVAFAAIAHQRALAAAEVVGFASAFALRASADKSLPVDEQGGPFDLVGQNSWHKR